jgi:NTE family protein
MATRLRAHSLEAALSAIFENAPGGASWFSLPGGGRLFAAGDPSDTLYLLRSGRLGVFRQEEGHDPQFLGVIKPGEPAGEMALIAGTPHTSTVVALRDSEILALPHDDFIAAAQAHPEVMTELARLMILRARQAGNHAADPTVFGFTGVSERPIRPFVDLVEAEIAGMGFSVKVVDSSALKSATGWFSAIEETHDFVLYVAEKKEVAWSHLCARQVDRLFIVGRAVETPPTGRVWGSDPLQDQRLVDLILLHKPTAARPSGTEAWLKALAPTRWFHVKGGERSDAARIARILTGTSVGLVLSGGGARAYAHMGVVKGLRESGTPIDFVGGASMGAIIGAGVAMGWSWEEEDDRIRQAFVNSSPVDDIAFPIIAMTKGRKVDDRLREHFGEVAIEDLWRPFFCVASNITSGGYVVDKEGLVRSALRASISLPGVLPPVVRNGAVLVDGAVMRNFPVDIMRAWHNGPVVGADVSRSRGVDPKTVTNAPPWWKWLLSGGWRQGPPIVSVIMRSATLTTKAELLLARSATDLLIVPNPQKVEIRDWKAYDAAVESGYETTLQALAKLEGPVTFLRRRQHDAAAHATVRALRLDAPGRRDGETERGSSRPAAAGTPAKSARGKPPKSVPARGRS